VQHKDVDIKLLNPLRVHGERVNPEARLRDTTDLQESIKEVGLLTPVLVMPNGEGYYILSGERRWKACQKLQWTTIPVLVLNTDDPVMALLAGNVQREFTPLQQANVCRLLAEDGKSQTAIARSLGGKGRAYVEILLKLLEAHPAVQELVESGKMALSTFRTIAWKSQEEQQLVIDKSLTRSEDGRITRRAIKKAVKRVEDDRQPERLAGDPEALGDIALRVLNDLEALAALSPFNGGEKLTIRALVEQAGNVLTDLDASL
jgi:ParB family chromosome partitioning protein